METEMEAVRLQEWRMYNAMYPYIPGRLEKQMATLCWLVKRFAESFNKGASRGDPDKDWSNFYYVDAQKPRRAESNGLDIDLQQLSKVADRING